MDPRRDTFAKVLERAGDAGGDPHPRLKRRETATLHGFYLRALLGAEDTGQGGPAGSYCAGAGTGRRHAPPSRA